MNQLEIEISLLEQIVKKMSELYVTGAPTPHEIVGRMLAERQCGKVHSGYACTMPKGSECQDCGGIRSETIGEGD
jgi:hypothetical protein